jgi:hypothetical protein
MADDYEQSLMDWAAILHETMWFWPFKDPEVTERFADGLLKAGLPGQPSGYHKIYEERNLTGDEIKELVFGRTIRGIHYWSGEFRIDRTMDGKMSSHKVPGKSIFDHAGDEGTSWIEGDMLCEHWQFREFGIKNCWTLFPNPEGMPEMKDEYLLISDFRIHPFSPVD